MKSTETPSTQNTSERYEREAEDKLQALLSDPENSFLNEIPKHRDYIENHDSSVEALEYAELLIKERLEKSTNFSQIGNIEGLSLENVNVAALRESVLNILKNQHEIGRGGDAFVVVDKNEVRELPPEVCYKFALEEATPRGRNSTTEEAFVHSLFYEAVSENKDSKIGVPIPFYVLEVGSHKMIAMEKLPAASIDDIMHSKGFLPKNFDVETFCDELNKLLDHLHSKGLYHRDMHFGNVMITQKEELEEGDKWGYLIDFGLSASGVDEDMAYEKERAGETFTYSNDYGIIQKVKSDLEEYQGRITGSHKI